VAEATRWQWAGDLPLWLLPRSGSGRFSSGGVASAEHASASSSASSSSESSSDDEEGFAAGALALLSTAAGGLTTRGEELAEVSLPAVAMPASAATATATLRLAALGGVLCPFELHGSCNDADCKYQHLRTFAPGLDAAAPAAAAATTTTTTGAEAAAEVVAKAGRDGGAASGGAPAAAATVDDQGAWASPFAVPAAWQQPGHPWPCGAALDGVLLERDAVERRLPPLGSLDPTAALARAASAAPATTAAAAAAGLDAALVPEAANASTAAAEVEDTDVYTDVLSDEDGGNNGGEGPTTLKKKKIRGKRGGKMNDLTGNQQKGYKRARNEAAAVAVREEPATPAVGPVEKLKQQLKQLKKLPAQKRSQIGGGEDDSFLAFGPSASMAEDDASSAGESNDGEAISASIKDDARGRYWGEEDEESLGSGSMDDEDGTINYLETASEGDAEMVESPEAVAATAAAGPVNVALHLLGVDAATAASFWVEALDPAAVRTQRGLPRSLARVSFAAVAPDTAGAKSSICQAVEALAQLIKEEPLTRSHKEGAPSSYMPRIRTSSLLSPTDTIGALLLHFRLSMVLPGANSERRLKMALCVLQSSPHSVSLAALAVAECYGAVSIRSPENSLNPAYPPEEGTSIVHRLVASLLLTATVAHKLRGSPPVPSHGYATLLVFLSLAHALVAGGFPEIAAEILDISAQCKICCRQVKK
jgi:hypothetical protein